MREKATHNKYLATKRLGPATIHALARRCGKYTTHTHDVYDNNCTSTGIDQGMIGTAYCWEW